MPHAALYVVQPELCGGTENVSPGFNAAHSIVCGATREEMPLLRKIPVSMPHAALYVVQHHLDGALSEFLSVSMPHAALYVVQP